MKKIVLAKIVLSVILTVVFLIGCPTSRDEVTPDNPTVQGKIPGKFSATVLSDAMGSNARGISLGTYTVANSKSIFFILRNVGDFPITNIALTPGRLLNEGGAFVPITDNGITASPSAITVLETSGNTTVETVIEVDINHGNVIGLISQQYIHKADFAGATLRITGKTRNEEGDVLDISLDLDIETFIKVASFEVHYSTNGGTTWKKAEYGHPMRRLSPGEPSYVDTDGLGFLIPSNEMNYIKILNTGNIPLRYKVHEVVGSNFSWESLNEWKNINAGEYSENLSSSSSTKQFLIDSIGIAFDSKGIEDFIFRSNTSIITSSFYQGFGIYCLYDDKN